MSALSQRFTLTIAMDTRDADSLLRLVSVFHRRQVEILHATYSDEDSHRRLVAVVETTAARLGTLARTIGNTIGVTSCALDVQDDENVAQRAG